MVTRYKAVLEWSGRMWFKCVIPISRKIIDSCPIKTQENRTAVMQTINEVMNYDYLHSSMMYELNLRKNIYIAIKKTYNPLDEYNTNIERLLETLDFTDESEELSHLAVSLMNLYHYELESESKGKRFVDNLNTCYKTFINPEFNGFQKKLDEYLGIVKPKRVTRNPESRLTSFINMCSEELNLYRKFSFERELIYEGKTINLSGFVPDTCDYRNIMVPAHVDNYRVKLISNKNNEFSSTLFYDNPGRPFEDFLSAILARELVTTYLNKLESIV